MIKVKRGGKEIYLKDESEVDKDDEVVDKNVIVETPEDVARAEKFLDGKVDELIKAIKDNPVRTSIITHKDEPDLNKSVMEQDRFLRGIRPFVKLSLKMEGFVKDMKVMARGGIPTSMQKALNEGDDSEGGYTVPEEFSNEVIRYASEQSVVRSRARVFNMTRDIFSAPKLDQDSVADGDHFGGVVFYYTAESGTGTESAPRFGKVKLEAKKLVGLTVATDELLEDSAVNIANFLVSLFGEALGFKEDIDFLQGTGMGKPLGVINAAGITSVTRNTASRIKYQDILGMEENLLSAFDRNSVWMTTKAGRGQIVQIQVDTTSALVFQPSLRDGYPDTLLGRPFIVVDNAKLPALGTTGDILLGDFSQYYIGDRGAMKVSSSIHDRFRQDETVFKFVKRFDGQPAIPKAFVKLTT